MVSNRIAKTKLNPVMTFLQDKIKFIVPPAIALFIILLVWQGLCPTSAKGFPGPIQVIRDTWNPYIVNPFFNNGGTDVGLGLQILASLKRVAIGFTFSAVVGIATGIIIGSNNFLLRAFDPIFQVLRTIPPLAWLPISLAIFQSFNPLDMFKIQVSETSALFVIFITAVWPIIINTMVGVQQLPTDYRNVARVLKLRQTKFFFKILFPATVPYIFTGLRIAVGLAWLAIVAAEMLVGGVGIGFFIWDAYNNSLMGQIIIALVYVGLVGLALDRLVAFIGSLVLPKGQN